MRSRAFGNFQQWCGPQWRNKRVVALLFIVVFIMLPLVLFRPVVDPIGTELSKKSDMTTAVKISLVLCGGVYFAIGLFVYLLFGDSIMADILVNFDQNSGSVVDSLLNDFVRLGYVFHLMMVFPLLNLSLRANLDKFFSLRGFHWLKTFHKSAKLLTSYYGEGNRWNLTFEA